MSNEIKKNLEIINRHFDFMKKTYNVKKIGIFGSMARKTEKKTSDIDILVELSQPTSFLEFIKLENFLKKSLGRRVDLATKNSLKPITKKNVLKDIVYAR